MSGPVGLRATKRCMKSKSKTPNEQLLPGLPDEITFNLIALKLSWRACHALSSVSRDWRRATQNLPVYDASVRSHPTETLALVVYKNYETRALALYSMADRCFLKLLLIPWLGLPYECQIIPLDGKLFVLGGLNYNNNWCDFSRNEVYVLDLAGQMQWKPCARMQQPRRRFGCAVVDGKIFVFVGAGRDVESGCWSEVFDTKANTWSPIKRIPIVVRDVDVVTIGEELFLHGVMEMAEYDTRDVLEVYHPGKDEWRLKESLAIGMGYNKNIFTAQGKIHSMTYSGTCVLDLENKSWNLLHKVSVAGIGPFTTPKPFSSIVKVSTAVAVDDGLVASVYWDEAGQIKGSCFVQSTEFGSEEEIVLRKVEFPRSFAGWSQCYSRFSSGSCRLYQACTGQQIWPCSRSCKDS